MNCNELGYDLIRECEGLRLKAYQDTGGVWTIGFGHCGKDVQPNSVIDEHTAEVLLTQDIATAERSVRRLAFAALNENQFSALVCFVFNLGEGKLRGTKTISLLNQKRYLDFADAMLQWDKVTLPDGTKEPLPGLTERRKKERALFLRPLIVT
ncbi:MAG: lysozyme [Planctomycetes bacterium]|nr:lysozyme [Planctomycetota bacterium]